MPPVPLAGHVMAGTLPVTAASVQLYAAGTAGNGSAPTALLAAAVLTDASGGFSLPTYACPANDPLVYLVARGGAVSGTTNAGLALLTVPGTCSALANGPLVLLNEATTVASAYAFHAFLNAGAQLGAAATNHSGLLLAEGTLTSLVDLSAGTSPGPALPANSSDPSPQINSLANLLNACLSSTGPGSGACTSLYSNTALNGSAPNNTLDALGNLLSKPDLNAAAIYTLTLGSTAYGNVLRAQPTDWVLSLTLSGGGMNAPTGVALDSAGQVWVASLRGRVSQFSNAGAPLFSNGISGYGLGTSWGIAVDGNDLAWVMNWYSPANVNNGSGAVVLLGASGGAVTTSGYFSSGVSYPTAAAIDTDGTVWIASYGNSAASHLSASGVPLSGATGYSSSDIKFPVAVAVDANHNAWLGDGDAAVTRLLNNGSQTTPYQCCSGPTGIAVDAGNNIWATNFYASSLSLISSAGTIVSNGFTGGGLKVPNALAVDGIGNIWVANYRGGNAAGTSSLSQFSGTASPNPGTALSPSLGWAPDAGLVEAYSVALDSSGSIWVTSFGTNTLVKYVGLAAPVRTPLLGPVRTP